MANSRQTPQIRRITCAQFDADTVADVIKTEGGLIIEGFFDPEVVKRVNKEMNPGFAALQAGSKRDDPFTVDFHGKNTKRLTNLATISETFRKELLDHDAVHAVAERVFRKESGSYWLTSAQAIEIGPGNPAQTLHRDLENYYPFLNMGPTGPQVSLNFLMAVTDFTEQNGATRVLPGSQLWKDYQDRGSPDDTIPALMKPGDVLCIGGKIVHGGGANVTATEFRRGIAFSFNPGFLTPEEAYPFTVPMELAKEMSPRAQEMLGFRSQYPKGCPGLWQNNYTEIAEFLKL
ncbi:hypothetical protein VE00_04305 [Pseudogymnoascus sp. WSF 3629]|nr:hypothetical protein VE00_04305 [Pseudogymnoascus sp. WSF 3629]